MDIGLSAAQDAPQQKTIPNVSSAKAEKSCLNLKE